MDTPVTDSKPVPSFFDERPADPEAPYKMGRPHRNFSFLKGFFYLIGIMSLFVFAGFLYFGVLKPALKMNTTPTATSSVVNSVDSRLFWEIYKINGLWEFSYPKGWVVLTKKQADSNAVGISDRVDVMSGTAVGTVFLQVASSNFGDSFDSVFNKEVGDKTRGISNTITILDKSEVDGYPSITYSLEVSPKTSDEYSYSIVTLIKGPTNVNISGLSIKSSGRPDSEFVKTYLPIHEKIVSSFKFAQ